MSMTKVVKVNNGVRGMLRGLKKMKVPSRKKKNSSRVEDKFTNPERLTLRTSLVYMISYNCIGFGRNCTNVALTDHKTKGLTPYVDFAYDFVCNYASANPLKNMF